MSFSRRGFLQSASASLGVALFDRSLLHAEDLENTFKEIRANVLEMINEERAVEKVPPLAMDELATQVATKHAVEMAADEYVSHWGRDGRKPYHRYSFAGGTEATQENVSAADNTWSRKSSDLKQDAAYLHVRLYQEQPPNDGHRRAILAPQHTHVGYWPCSGKVTAENGGTVCREVSRSRADSSQGEARRATHVCGKDAEAGYYLNHIEVFYEPLPKAPELSWLRQPRSYALPNESKVLRPESAAAVYVCRPQARSN